jgi:hypothetical protein
MRSRLMTYVELVAFALQRARNQASRDIYCLKRNGREMPWAR